MIWLVATYLPVAFFALRPANATASGGRTLLVPTAYALKMALLGATIGTAGLATGRSRWPAIRDLRLALAAPEHITVLKSFAKVQRLAEFKGKAVERPPWEAERRAAGEYPFGPTIAYRELVQFGDPLGAPLASAVRIAATAPAGEAPAWLAEAFAAINYLGKRGGFMQLAGPPEPRANLDDRFTLLTEPTREFAVNGTLQQLDDCGPDLTFDQADIYSSKRITLGKDRVLHPVVLPYRLVRSSRGYSLYEWLGAGGAG